MFSLLLWWVLTVDNGIDTKPMTPTSTTWSNQNIIDWPVMLCTLHEQKEVLWRTPTTWLRAWPGMVRRPITSEWCGEATGLRTSIQTPGNTQRLQAKRNMNDDVAVQCAWAQTSRWYHFMTSWCTIYYVSLCQNLEEFNRTAIKTLLGLEEFLSKTKTTNRHTQTQTKKQTK